MSKNKTDLSSDLQSGENAPKHDNSVIKSEDYGDVTGALEGRQDIPTFFESLGFRLETAASIIGMDKSVHAANRSMKQLRRYFAGDEPPLGVIIRLANAANLSVKWLVTGSSETLEDAEANVETNQRYVQLISKKQDGTPEAIELRRVAHEMLRIAVALRDAKRRVEGHSTDIETSERQFGHSFSDNQTALHDGMEPSQFTLVPRYGIRASAGPGLTALDEGVTERLAFKTEWLRQLGLSPSNLGLVTARGHSQEPTIPDGSLLLVDLSPDQQIRSGFFYIIVLDGDLMVKRLFRRVDGNIDLISDNPAYPLETIASDYLDKLTIPGRVVWIGHSI